MENGSEMSQAQVEQKLIAIGAKLLVLEPEKISASSVLKDLPWDSLGQAEYMMEVEDKFDLSIDEDAHENLFPGKPATIASLAELIIAEKKK